jgi:hypothetical protein
MLRNSIVMGQKCHRSGNFHRKTRDCRYGLFFQLKDASTSLRGDLIAPLEICVQIG